MATLHDEIIRRFNEADTALLYLHSAMYEEERESGSHTELWRKVHGLRFELNQKIRAAYVHARRREMDA